MKQYLARQASPPPAGAIPWMRAPADLARALPRQCQATLVLLLRATRPIRSCPRPEIGRGRIGAGAGECRDRGGQRSPRAPCFETPVQDCCRQHERQLEQTAMLARVLVSWVCAVPAHYHRSAACAAVDLAWCRKNWSASYRTCANEARMHCKASRCPVHAAKAASVSLYSASRTSSCHAQRRLSATVRWRAQRWRRRGAANSPTLCDHCQADINKDAVAGQPLPRVGRADRRRLRGSRAAGVCKG